MALGPIEIYFFGIKDKTSLLDSVEALIIIFDRWRLSGQTT